MICDKIKYEQNGTKIAFPEMFANKRVHKLKLWKIAPLGQDWWTFHDSECLNFHDYQAF